VTRSSKTMVVTQAGTEIVRLIRSILQGAPAIGHRRPIRTEWDNDVPPFPILIGEVARAEATLTAHARRGRRLAR
jgi:hypothetical protein